MANLEIVSLETGTPQLRAPGTGDGYLAPRTLNITPEANTSALTASSYSLTGSNAQSLLDLAGTWDTTGTPTALKLNVTDTASNAASLLMDLQVGGVSKFSVTKGGVVTLAAGSKTAPSIQFTGISGPGIYGRAGTSFAVTSGTAETFQIGSSGGLAAINSISISPGDLSTTGADVILARDAADTLAQRRTTNAQTFRIYNTYTDASNYERGKLQWDTNVLKIGTEKAGTGSARALELQTDGTTRLTIQTDGYVYAASVLYSNGFIGQNNKFRLTGASDGVLTLSTWGTGDFGRLQFGGTTSSFPALKRNLTGLDVRLADDSAYAPLALGRTLTGTATDPALFVQGDWSTTGTATLIKANLNADTGPSNAASLLMDLQVGGVSQFSVGKSGDINFVGTLNMPSGGLVQTTGSNAMKILTTGTTIRSQVLLSGSGLSGDVVLARDAADTLAQRNGANAQTFRIYNTTDAGIANYERGGFDWSGNVLRIGVQAAGTGTARAVRIGSFEIGGGGTSTIGASVAVGLYSGKLQLNDINLELGTTTGTKIGTATSQKLAFWNATPVVQPTTAISAGAFVANTSGITDDSATFDGYTIGQVVAALRQIGALA